jgi:hypothetical protein
MMSADKEEQEIERLITVMRAEAARFDAESAWRERDFPEHERERRQVKIILAELKVMRP